MAKKQAFYADSIYYNGEEHLKSWLLTDADGVITGIQQESPSTQEYQTTVFADSAIFPAFINTHTHLSMAYMRGMAEDYPLMDWLNNYIFPTEKRFISSEFVRDASRFAALELIKNGTLGISDMYFEPQDTLQVMSEAGLKGLIGVNIDTVDKGILDVFKDFPNFRPALIPHAIYTVSEEDYKKHIDVARKHDITLHTHLSESLDEVRFAKEKYNTTPTQLMDSWGIFDIHSVMAHCVHLTEKDIDILGSKGVNVAHCPKSNLKLASGIAPIKELISAGANVTVATDGVASNNNLSIIEETSIAAKLHKAANYDATFFDVDTALNAITSNAAKALRMDSGSLSVGKSADFIVVSYDEIHMMPIYRYASNLIYASNSSDITHLYSSAQPIMADRKVKVLDEDEIKDRAKFWHNKITTAVLGH